MHTLSCSLLRVSKGISVLPCCAHPYCNRLLGLTYEDAYNCAYNGAPQVGMLRASLGIYNTQREAEMFIAYIKYLISTL